MDWALSRYHVVGPGEGLALALTSLWPPSGLLTHCVAAKLGLDLG